MSELENNDNYKNNIDDCPYLPALICCTCGLVWSCGGSEWERTHPNQQYCTCNGENKKKT